MRVDREHDIWTAPEPAQALSPDTVSKAVPVLTSFVSKSGDADVGKLLAGALK
jgi:hypothetical protein